MACKSIRAITWLIKQFANVNGRNDSGDTPLHYAVQHNDNSIIKILLENGADRHIQNKKGLTPIGLAQKISNDLMTFLRGSPSSFLSFLLLSFALSPSVLPSLSLFLSPSFYTYCCKRIFCFLVLFTLPFPFPFAFLFPVPFPFPFLLPFPFPFLFLPPSFS